MEQHSSLIKWSFTRYHLYYSFVLELQKPGEQMRNYLVNILLSFIPSTRFFRLKSFLLNLLGLKVHKTAKLCGDIKVYGTGVLEIGAHSWIGIGCTFYLTNDSPIKIDANCDIAPQVSFITGSHEIGDKNRRAGKGTSSPITIGRGSWIGGNSTILGGTKIGEGTVVGASTLVLGKQYPSSVLLAGSPAVIKKEFKGDDNE